MDVGGLGATFGHLGVEGGGGASAPTVTLSNLIIPASATVGTLVGVLGTVNTTGSYTYTFTSNPGTLFAIVGANLNTNAALSAGTDPIIVHAVGGVPSPLDQTFNIIVTVLPANAGGANLPVISGTTQVGFTLSTSNGTWTGYPPPTFTYQWQRGGVNIAGATASSYTLVTADAGTMISVVVTGTNVAGSANATAAAVGPIAMAPANSVLPLISGTAQVGQTLSTTNGTWSGTPAPSFTYQWKRGGVAIGGATANSYALVVADIGSTITATVTGTNSAGSSAATSAAVGPVVGIAPANTVLPAISGTTVVGSVLSTTDGTWTGTPSPTFTYQWKRNGVAIGGATANSYLLVTADLTATITVTVTGTNVAGSANATSAGVGPITSGNVAPANTVLPVISGATTVGSTLSTTDGTWTGVPAPTFTYQWTRNTVNIAGATANTYLLVTADLTTTIAVVVTATNVAGSASATAAGVGPITSGSAFTPTYEIYFF